MWVVYDKEGPFVKATPLAVVFCGKCEKDVTEKDHC